MKQFSNSKYWLVVFILIFSCQEKDQGNVISLSEGDLIEKGRVLSESKCGSCHLYPEPGILDKQTWLTSVLPAMKPYIISDEKEDQWKFWLPKNKSESSEMEYEAIATFYEANAPSSLTVSSLDNPSPGIPGFKVETPILDEKRPNLSTFVLFDSLTNRIWVGDRLKMIYGINPQNFIVEEKIEVGSTPVQLTGIDSTTIEVLTMGEMDPSDYYKGELISYDLSSKTSTILLDSLNRPVYFRLYDQNALENKKWLVSEFGNLEGALSIQSPDSTELLVNLPGCRKSIQIDWDLDGDLDILAGFGQAKESLYWIENKGEGRFENHLLEEFHPAFGLSDLAVKDVNKDGYLDIILVNGDNADLSPIIKPYHGVRIYFGNGNRQLELNCFYPIPGAMSLVAEDFDKDGSLEMAVVSFFPDFRNDERVDWLYFDSLEVENKAVFRLPVPLLGKWLTISSGDIDLDGDLDILTGSFMFQPGVNYAEEQEFWSEDWSPFFVLRNQLK